VESNPFISNLRAKLEEKKKELTEILNKEYQSILEQKRKEMEEIKRKALKELSK
jgi:F0F1-type ATP synthase membrane subunit b/b'